ncbi:hypothetical protein PO909_031291 [Leuciscus waleckii]
MKYGLTINIYFCLYTDGPPPNCCLKLGYRGVRLEKVLNYRIQIEGLCPIKAVVIQTVSGKILCSDLNSNWTKRAMRKVDEAKKAREQESVPAEGASAEESRGRADPVTATELPLNSRRYGVRKKNERKAQKPIRVPKKRDQKKAG